ncbi:MAG: DUF2274 domain-containing protein [Parvibaculum sp.]
MSTTLAITPDALVDAHLAVKVELTGQLARDLELYAELYREEHGTEIKQEHLVRELVRLGIASDRAFQKRKKKRTDAADRKPARQRQAASTASQPISATSQSDAA